MEETNDFFDKFYFDAFSAVEEIISFTTFVRMTDDAMINEFNVVRRNEEYIGMFNYPHFMGTSMTQEAKQEVTDICFSGYTPAGSFLRVYKEDLIYGMLLSAQGKTKQD